MNTANKHTPGPWSYTVDVSHTGGSDPVNMVSYRIYAQGYKRGQTHDYPCLGTLNGAGASEADAALIAAAPTMLDVLHEALRCVTPLLEEPGEFPRDTCPADLFHILNEVIVKAEGRS